MNATDMHTSLYRNQQRRIDRAEHPANKDHKLCPNKNIETNQAIVEQPLPKKKKKKSNKKNEIPHRFQRHLVENNRRILNTNRGPIQPTW